MIGDSMEKDDWKGVARSAVKKCIGAHALARTAALVSGNSDADDNFPKIK